jgi:hypothetical protein
MPTSAEIEHISSLVNRLLPLSQTARGELIRAQDWNLVVAALIELAQSLIAFAPDAVPPHDHLEQVKLEWLEPKMKTLVQRGALADPSELGRLAMNERAVADLRGQVDGTGGDVHQLRLELTQLAGRDLDRDAQLQTVNLKLNGFTDARDDVVALRASLSSLQDNVNVAVSVGQHLTVDGQPVDMKVLSDRLRALEGFRDGLRSASGAPLDASALTNQIKQATTSLVTRTDLETALAHRPAVVSPEQLQGLGDRLSASLKADVTTTINQLGDGIRAQTDQRFATIDALVGRAVGDALPSLADTLLGKVRPEITAALQTGVTQLQATFEKRLADTLQAAQNDLTSKLGDLRIEFGNSLRDQLSKQLAVSLEPVQKSLDDLSLRVKRNGDTIAVHETALGTVQQRVEAVAQADATARDQVKAEVTRELTSQTQALTTRLDARFASADAAMTKSFGDLTKRVDDLNIRVRRPQ